MNVYRRIFRIQSGPLSDAVSELNLINKKASKSYVEILKEIGAEDSWYQVNGCLDCVIFKEAPDSSIYKRKGKGWYPKKNCKKGKDLAKRIESIETKNIKDLLETVGLSKFPSIYKNSKCYSSTIIDIPENIPVIYISVPWYDEDPEIIKEYKIKNTTGFSRDNNMDSILWEPTKDMEEVKEWEMNKHIEEWNEKVKAKQK